MSRTVVAITFSRTIKAIIVTRVTKRRSTLQILNKNKGTVLKLHLISGISEILELRDSLIKTLELLNGVEKFYNYL